MESLIVGQRVRRREEMEAAPPGTTVTDSSRRTWTKNENGLWSDPSGGAYAVSSFSVRGMTWTSFPGGVDQWEPSRQTVAQVKHRYRVGALAAAHAHGVNIDVVDAALREMGAGPEVIQPVGQGVLVPLSDGHPADLPVGTVLYAGSPERPSSLGVFRWNGTRFEHLLGGRTYVDNAMVVESVAGVMKRPAWLDAEGTEADDEAIAEFKALAWRVGWKLKRAQGWCGTYEEIVHGLGVKLSDVRGSRYAGFARGQRVTRDEAIRLPVGSVLWWQDTTDARKFAVFARRDQATNRAGTLRVFASEGVTDNENCKRYMTVAGIHRGDELESDFDLSPYGSARVFPYLPAGTVFRANNNGESLFLKCHDGRVTMFDRSTVVPSTGQWTYPQSFNGAELIVVSMP